MLSRAKRFRAIAHRKYSIFHTNCVKGGFRYPSDPRSVLSPWMSNNIKETSILPWGFPEPHPGARPGETPPQALCLWGPVRFSLKLGHVLTLLSTHHRRRPKGYSAVRSPAIKTHSRAETRQTAQKCQTKCMHVQFSFFFFCSCFAGLSNSATFRITLT